MGFFENGFQCDVLMLRGDTQSCFNKETKKEESR